MSDMLVPEQLELIPPTHPMLNKMSATVQPDEVPTAYIQAVIDRMLQLAAGKGRGKEDTRQMVGLAAPQIGVAKRIMIIDMTANGSNKKQMHQAVINPQLVGSSVEMALGREGCWSCGNICGIVERTKEVTVKGLDRSGAQLTLWLSGFTARIAQHEVDHLQGERFPDRVPVDKPERLHWVQPSEFETYRQTWMHWPHLCPRERWEEMKAGI